MRITRHYMRIAIAGLLSSKMKNALPFFLLLSIFMISYPAFSYQTHRYVVDDARLIIHPVNVSLDLKQKHALLYEIANDIKSQGREEFTGFIAICLQELAYMYEEEATRPDKKPDREISGGTGSWRTETMSVANELYQVAATLTPDMNLEVDMDDTGELMIEVEDKIYILSNPLINKPHALDERIINRVCQIRYCSPDIISARESFDKRTIVIEANWVIAEDKKPEYVTRDGLHFVFDNLDRRRQKQIGSLKLIKEIELVTGSLIDAAKKGVLLDWEILAIKPFLGSYDYRIQLNRFSDSIHVSLPELHHVDNWQETVFPWIKARVQEIPADCYINGDKALAYVLE